MAKRLKNLIGGKWLDQRADRKHQIINPTDGKSVVVELGYSTAEDVADAVAAAAEAFGAWRDMPVVRRCRILFHCKELLEQRTDDIAESVVTENGKLYSEAEGEIRRGLEVLEFACGMPSMSKGDFIEDISRRVDGYIYREPLGVVAGACPFNFPAMIPMWMYPVAIACGNTFVLKPSEKCPATATLISGIFRDGGLPDGVLNVVQGQRETFEALITNPDVSAISFVGSTRAAKSVWELATSNHKRVQSLGGAKNYIVIMPDADVEQTVNNIVHSAYGCAGQRCMAASVLVVVSGAEPVLERIIEEAGAMKLGNGMDEATQMGPVISGQSKERIEGYIDIGLEEGASLALDGRGANVEEFPDGFFLGASILDNVRPDMRVAREEIFGPVLSVMHAKNLDEALDLVNASPYGNGNSIFTSSGGAARHFRNRVVCGMIGINAGVPAPMAFFSFGGRKDSIFGDLRAHGPDSVEFYTQKKAVIERWFGTGKTGSVWGRK
ncbi:MAG: CoA-acylating methylmalonate-semialdehyde dehydrogenase [Planctomycetota bacterium]|nr:CoA-acylating methylmalonate-semialdehyde dehydrogenase [Planctomycetota bacterium]